MTGSRSVPPSVTQVIPPLVLLQSETISALLAMFTAVTHSHHCPVPRLCRTPQKVRSLVDEGQAVTAAAVEESVRQRDAALGLIGNLLHDSCIVSNDEVRHRWRWAGGVGRPDQRGDSWDRVQG